MVDRGDVGVPRRTGLQRSSLPVRLAVFLPLLAAVGIHLGGAVARRWVQEDGFITIRVAQQVLAGNGPVYNAGERVEAFTSPR
jgi:arabinofuranosyltransferase